MALIATEHIGMGFMREIYGHGRTRERESRHLVASVTDLPVQRDLLMRFDDVALVAVHAESHMFRVRELPGLVGREFFIGVAAEAREGRIFQRGNHRGFHCFGRPVFFGLPPGAGEHEEDKRQNHYLSHYLSS